MSYYSCAEFASNDQQIGFALDVLSRIYIEEFTNAIQFELNILSSANFKKQIAQVSSMHDTKKTCSLLVQVNFGIFTSLLPATPSFLITYRNTGG